MKIKSFILLLFLGLLILILTTFYPVIKTYFTEGKGGAKTPTGYTNDASGLSLTKIDSIIDVPHTRDSIVTQLRNILGYARKNKIGVSIAGAKHSMGGHTMYPNGIVLNMRPYNQMELDSNDSILTIGSGALWEEALAYLDKYGKSIEIMQSFSSFSIGGSLSVNGHGWQKSAPPISASVVSFTLMNYKAEVIHCSRTENQELFSLVTGGYGLFGIMLDIRIKVIDNQNLKSHQYKIKPGSYVNSFKTLAVDDPNVKLAYGRINIARESFLEDATITVFKQDSGAIQKLKKKDHPDKMVEFKRLIFRSTVNDEKGKRLRWFLETKTANLQSGTVYTRNEILDDHASAIENKDPNSTDILHEYFIPERNFNAYIAELKKVLPDDKIDILNITIRSVYKDNDSYLPYANENVFGFVFLFNQKKTEAQEQEMKNLTVKLLKIAAKMQGTYYLPYRLHADKTMMRKMYPKADEFFRLKLQYDPEELFRNKFYDHYK